MEKFQNLLKEYKNIITWESHKLETILKAMVPTELLLQKLLLLPLASVLDCPNNFQKNLAKFCFIWVGRVLSLSPSYTLVDQPSRSTRPVPGQSRSQRLGQYKRPGSIRAFLGPTQFQASQCFQPFQLLGFWHSLALQAPGLPLILSRPVECPGYLYVVFTIRGKSSRLEARLQDMSSFSASRSSRQHQYDKCRLLNWSSTKVQKRCLPRCLRTSLPPQACQLQ